MKEEVQLETDGRGSLYLPLLIDEVPVLALVDTGSTISVIHPSILNKSLDEVVVRETSKACQIRLADGSLVDTLGTVQLKVQLGTERESWMHDWVVSAIEAPMVIGVDFLREHQCTLDVRAGTLTVGSTIHECRRMESMPQMYRITVAETVEIPARSEMIIPGKMADVSQLTQGIVESNGQPMCKGDVFVARAVVNPSMGVLPLRVANLGMEPHKLHKGTNIAICEPVMSVSEMSSNDKICSMRQTESSQFCTHDGQQSLPAHVAKYIDECKDYLSPHEIDLAEGLLHECQDGFAKSKDDLSTTDADEHGMTMVSPENVKLGPRRLPLAKRQALKCELDRLLKLGVIEPSKSSWASPIVMVTKKDGSLRLCVDFRLVNKLTLKDSYPLPRIDDSIDALRGSKWFSTLDLASGYWQVPMAKKDVEKTAFATPFGLYQFKVMPFGLANAPATFERMMERVLSGLHWETCLIYLDDVIVFSKTFEEHIVRLHQVLTRLRNAKLKLSPTKCKLFRQQVEYLGHVVSKDGVGTDPKKIEAIASWPTPRNQKEVRSFVGLCSYYRRFVRGFADIARPLHHAVELGTEFRWTDDCERAFQELKAVLTSPPILAYPEDAGAFILDTDASGEGLGAVLSQVQGGKECVIGYFSRALTKEEQQYCVTRRELLAVVMAVQHFHYYLYGRHFTIRSDHGSLRWLMNFKNPEGQMWRWLRILSTYDFDIVHRPGKQHKNADGLSRRPCDKCRHCERQEMKQKSEVSGCPGHSMRAMDMTSDDEQWSDSWSAHQIREWQMADPVLSKVLTWVEAGVKPPQRVVRKEGATTRIYWSLFEQLELKNGVLYRKPETTEKQTNLKLVAPLDVQDRIFKCLHSSRTGGHQGVKRTNASVRQRFWWPGMQKDVARWCRYCDLCQRHNTQAGAHRSNLHQLPVGAPMERVAFDILSFPDETADGNTCILVVCDYFTKWVEAFALPDHKAVSVADTLVTEVFLRFGVPRYLHSDQAPEFMGELMTELSVLLEIQRTRTCPYRPQSDGLVERFNRTLINMLSKFCDENRSDWDQHLPFLLCAYRATANASTGCSPNLMMLGRETNLPVDLMFPTVGYRGYRCHNEYVQRVKRFLEDNYEMARQQLGAAAERQKRYYDARTKNRQYKEGDFVLRFYAPNLKNKLNSPYTGPFRIMARLGEVNYKIQRSPSSKHLVVHVDHLKPFHSHETPVAWKSFTNRAVEEPTVEETRDNTSEISEESDVDNSVNQQVIEESDRPQISWRPVRTRKLPGHLADYYLD